MERVVLLKFTSDCNIRASVKSLGCLEVCFNVSKLNFQLNFSHAFVVLLCSSVPLMDTKFYERFFLTFRIVKIVQFERWLSA